MDDWECHSKLRTGDPVVSNDETKITLVRTHLLQTSIEVLKGYAKVNVELVGDFDVWTNITGHVISHTMACFT